MNLKNLLINGIEKYYINNEINMSGGGNLPELVSKIQYYPNRKLFNQIMYGGSEYPNLVRCDTSDHDATADDAVTAAAESCYSVPDRVRGGDVTGNITARPLQYGGRCVACIYHGVLFSYCFPSGVSLCT